MEIFIGHDLFGFGGRHVLHYERVMINLLQYSHETSIRDMQITSHISPAAAMATATNRVRSNAMECSDDELPNEQSLA